MQIDRGYQKLTLVNESDCHSLNLNLEGVLDQVLFEQVKKLQKKTGLALHVCKKALDESGRDFDQALALLKGNGLIQGLSKKEILDRCTALANEWALDFLETTRETGELPKYHTAGRIHVIQDNFFSWYVIGVPGRCPYLVF